MGCLYSITSPNGKQYIGITVRDLKERWRVHRASANTRCRDGVLQKAIRKYGAESFKIETLVIANDFEYLKDLEIKAIKAFNTKTPAGYNMTDGGDGVLGVVVTAEGRKRRSEAQRKSFSIPERKERHLAAMRTPEIRAMRAAHRPSAETREKISAALKKAFSIPEVKAKLLARPKRIIYNDGLDKSQRHRLKNLDEYRRRKREYAKTPEQREKRRLYMLSWYRKNHAKALAQAAKSRSKRKTRTQ